MAKKNPDGTINFSADPEVASELQRGQQRHSLQRMSKREREKAQRQAEKKRKQDERNMAAKPRHTSWLIDPVMKEWISDQADQLGCSDSQVVEFALHYLKGAIENGTLELSNYTEPMDHPFKKNRLIYPQISAKS